MNNKYAKIFDIDQMGIDLGGKVEIQVGADGKDQKRTIWTPQLAEELVKQISSSIPKGENVEIVHMGSAPMWVMAAAVAAIYPVSNTFHPPFEGVYLKIHNLKQGPVNKEAGVTFDIQRDGDIVYLTFYADKPDEPKLYGGGHHSYNPALIPLIKTPVIGPEYHICLKGNGSYDVTMSIATAYFDNCKSLSVLNAVPNVKGEDYYCCVTHCKERSLGTVTPKDEG